LPREANQTDKVSGRNYVLFVATVSGQVAAAGSIVFQQGKFGEPGAWCDPHDMDGMLLTIVPPFFLLLLFRLDATGEIVPLIELASPSSFPFFFFLFHFVRAQLTVVESCSSLEKKNLYIPLCFFFFSVCYLSSLIS
jgi:hypothetical protein